MFVVVWFSTFVLVQISCNIIPSIFIPSSRKEFLNHCRPFTFLFIQWLFSRKFIEPILKLICSAFAIKTGIRFTLFAVAGVLVLICQEGVIAKLDDDVWESDLEINFQISVIEVVGSIFWFEVFFKYFCCTNVHTKNDKR